jgi:hypothetical protein
VTNKTLLAATAAILLLFLAGMAALGAPPVASASGDEVARWFREHQDGVRTFVWTNTVSAPFLAYVVVMLRRLMPQPHRDVFLVGAIGLVVTGAVQSWIWAGLALHADALQPATARAIFDVVLFWGPVLTGATTTMLAPVTLLALKGEAGMPKWLGLLGAVVFLEQAVETITIYGTSGFTEPGGAMNMQLGAGLFFVWLLAFVGWAATTKTAQG